MQTRLSPAELIGEAERATGLSDWGEDDFRVPLGILVEAAEREAALTPLGRDRLRAWLALRLEQRLKMVDDRKRRPGLATQAIDRPLVITGLPRAGTTYLHTLVGLHHAALSPLFWQIYLTSPPPHASDCDVAAQVARMDEYMAFQGWYSPEIARAHIHRPELPEEDIFAFEYSFLSLYFTGYLDVPSYLGHLFAAGPETSFRWHRRFLQALQYGTTGRRPVLKAPGYTMQVPALLNAYPDARLIQNHRDPSRVMASVFSTMSATRVLFSDRAQQFTRDQAMAFMTMYAQGLTALADLRADPAMDERFIDVHYLDLERDPLACVKRAWRHADMPFTAGDEARVIAWAEANRKGQHGKHRYALADYGLTAADVHAAFSAYIERSGVELESAV